MEIEFFMVLEFIKLEYHEIFFKAFEVEFHKLELHSKIF